MGQASHTRQLQPRDKQQMYSESRNIPSLQFLKLVFVLCGLPCNPLPVETTTNCSVYILRALLQYFLWSRELQATDVSFRPFIFAAGARFLSRHLDDQQLQLLISAQTNWDKEQILNSPPNEQFRELLCRPVEGEDFEGIWIIKDPSLSMPHSKVLLWFHGTTSELRPTISRHPEL
jgi:hypothetical protein